VKNRSHSNLQLKHLILLCSAAIGLQGMSFDVDAKDNQFNKSIATMAQLEKNGVPKYLFNAQGEEDYRNILGRAYYSYDHQIGLRSAIDRNTFSIIATDPEGEVTFKAVKNMHDFVRDLGGKVTAGGIIHGVKLADESAYNNEHKETDREFTLTFYYKYAKTISIGTNASQISMASNSDALELFVPNNPGNLKNFIAGYGDKFVAGFDAGVMVWVNLTFKFHSVEDANTFSEKFSVGDPTGSLASVTLEIDGSFDNKNSIGELEITAHQVGGNAAEIAKVLPPTTIDLSDSTKLGDLTGNLMNYVTSASFTSQLDSGDANLYIFYPLITWNYTDLSFGPKCREWYKATYGKEDTGQCEAKHDVKIPTDYYFSPEVLQARNAVEQTKVSLDDGLDKDGITVAKYVYKNLRDKISAGDGAKLSKALTYYDQLHDFYYDDGHQGAGGKNLYQECYLPGNEAINCVAAAKELADDLTASGMTQEQIATQIKNYGFAINIGSVLTAYPVSPMKPDSDWDDEGDAYLGNLKGAMTAGDANMQKFTLLDSANKYQASAYIGVYNNDIDQSRFPVAQSFSLYSLVANEAPVGQLSIATGAGGTANSVEILRYNDFNMRKMYTGVIGDLHFTGSDRNIFSSTTLNDMVKQLSNPRHYVDNGDKINGSPREELGDFTSTFQFDNELPSNDLNTESHTYCRYIGAGEKPIGTMGGYLLNVTTNQESLGPVYQRPCVSAKPGDVLIYYEKFYHAIPFHYYYYAWNTYYIAGYSSLDQNQISRELMHKEDIANVHRAILLSPYGNRDMPHYNY